MGGVFAFPWATFHAKIELEPPCDPKWGRPLAPPKFSCGHIPQGFVKPNHTRPNFGPHLPPPTAIMPCALQNTVSGTSAQIMYNGANVQGLVGTEGSLFRFTAAKITSFSVCLFRMRATQGMKALGETQYTIALKRAGSMLYQVVLAMSFAGIAAKHSNTLLDATAYSSGGILESSPSGLQALPAWAPYVGLIALHETVMEVASQPLIKMSNDYQLFVEECLGVAGKSASIMMGEFGSDAEQAERSKTAMMVYVPLAVFFSRFSGFAMPMTVLQFHVIRFNFCLADMTKCLRLPFVLSSDFGLSAVSGEVSAYSSLDASNGYIDLYVRPASGAPVKLLANETALMECYLIANFVFLGDAEAAEMAQSSYQQWVPMSQQARLSVTGSSGVDQSEVKMDLNFVVPTASISFIARRADHTANWVGRWSELAANGPYSVAAGALPISPLKSLRIDVDHQPRVDILAAEAHQLNQYWYCSTMTTKFIYVVSFADQIADAQNSGFFNFAKAGAVTAYLGIDGECFTGSWNGAFSDNSSVIVTANARYWVNLRYRSGVLFLSWN